MNNHDRIERLTQTLSHLESDLLARQQATSRASRHLLPRVIFAFIGGLALVNLYFVDKLTAEFDGMLTSMTQMYTHFGRVASRMSDMRDYVAGMENNIALMPVIGDEMAGMSVDIDAMTRSVGTMTTHIGIMDQQITTMSVTVTDMSRRFRHLNYNVGVMSVDVQQMAKPVP